MKSIFDPQTREAIIGRIGSLDETCRPQWGKMTVTQMVRHCALCEEYYFGKINVKRSFLGRVVGKMAIRQLLKDEEALLRKSTPTSIHLLDFEDASSLEAEKIKWMALIRQYEQFERNDFVHWFFGKMNREELGKFIYKHCNHHLKQFNR